MSPGKRACFIVLGVVGAIFALSHIYSLITASYDRPEMSLAWVGVGTFLIYVSYKKLRKSKVPKLYIKLAKSSGDEPEYVGPFSNEPDLQLWYQTNKNKLEGVEDAKIVRA